MVNCENDIKRLINKFEGNISLYAIDDYNNEIKINENTIVETASCIKIFILIEYYNQILKNEISRNDMLIYDNKNDYVANGSGIISTKFGNYIVSIFINNFSNHYFYCDNPAILLGARISKLLFESFEQNKGKIK